MGYIVNNFKPPRHDFNATRTQDPCTISFKRGLSSADIATLKSDVEAKFAGIALEYSGSEFDYDVTVSGPRTNFQKAIDYILPGGRSDITIQPGRWRP